VDGVTRDAPVPTITAVTISREAKQFTGEIVRGLKDIGISLFFLISGAYSIYDLGFAFLLQADRQLTTDRRRMQCLLRCLATTSQKHETADTSSGQGLERRKAVAVAHTFAAAK
jgi:hypothetical protein